MLLAILPRLLKRTWRRSLTFLVLRLRPLRRRSNLSFLLRRRRMTLFTLRRPLLRRRRKLPVLLRRWGLSLLRWRSIATPVRLGRSEVWAVIAV